MQIVFRTAVFKGTPWSLRQFLITASPLKMIKIAFYFILKALFTMNVWPCRKNGSIRKIRLISKSMTSQHGYQAIAIHILPNMSRSECNKATKFVQLIEFNMSNIFVEKSYKKCAGETISRLLSKKSKLGIYLDQ